MITEVPLRELIDLVNLHTGVDCRETCRKSHFIEAKMLYIKLALNLTYKTLALIGEEIGLDHSSVLHYKKNKITNPYIFNKGMDTLYNVVKVQVLKRNPDIIETLEETLTDESKSQIIIRQRATIKALKKELYITKRREAGKDIKIYQLESQIS